MSQPQRHVTDHGVFGTPGDVSPWEIRFDPNDVAYVERSVAGVRIRVWAEPSLEDATVVVRTGTGVVTAHPMQWIGTGGITDLWEVEIASDSFEYSLAFRSGAGRPVYYAPSGVTNAIERIDRWSLGPDDGRGPDVPPWARGAVIYQIFPDRFANGDSQIDPPDVLEWGTAPDNVGFFGGDLIGVAREIDYLAELGVDAIYLNPIFSSASNHRYDTVDYYSVDWRLGGNDALRKLTEIAHSRDIKVILDASFNHCHPQFFAFADVARRGVESEFAQWFKVEDWPLRIIYRPHLLDDPSRPKLRKWFERWKAEVGVELVAASDDGPVFEPGYEAWYGVPTMPRVDLANPAARGYMLDVAAHWTAEYGIDGWRMDVARYVDPDFWDDFRRVVRAVNPDAYLLAEVFGDTSDWLQGNRFDATMNYTFRELVLHFLANRDLDGPGFLAGLTRLWGMYGEGVSSVNHNALSTHDVPRFLTLAGGDSTAFELAMVCQMLFPGAPGIYYGDEVGVTGGEDPECRATFPWESDPRQHSLHRHLADLVALRRRFPELRTARFRPLASTPDAVAFVRDGSDSGWIVAINRGAGEARFEVGDCRVLWGEGSVTMGALVVAGGAAVLASRSTS